MLVASSPPQTTSSVGAVPSVAPTELRISSYPRFYQHAAPTELQADVLRFTAAEIQAFPKPNSRP